MDNNFLVAQIAKLYYIDKIKQNEIAKRYQITPMQISRLLKTAEDDGIVTFHVKMPMDIDTSLGKAIKDKYKLKECIVLNMGNEENTKEKIGKYAADYVSNLIGNDIIIGMSWGKTIYEFALNLQYSKHSDCKVIQLAGGISQENNFYVTPTNIIQQVSTKLSCIPVFLNAPFSINSVEAKENLLDDPSNKYLMELAKKVDLIIIGTGDLSRKSTIVETGLLNEKDLDELEEMGAIGEIGGYPIDKNGNEVNWSKSKLYTGVSLDMIKRCENVICLTGESEKTPVLAAGMKSKCFNILITTNLAGEKLLEYS